MHRFYIPAFTLAYFLAGVLLHLNISFLLITPISTATGTITPLAFLPWFSAGAVILCGLIVASQAVKGTNRLRTLLYWAAWFACAAAVDRLFVFKSIEYIHYPQYAGLAILLGCWLDPDRSAGRAGKILFWTGLLGVLDEINQYLYLCKNYGDYLDFNDFLLNLLGGTAGLLLFYGFRTVPAAGRRRPESRRTRVLTSPEGLIAVAIGMALLLLVGSGRIKMTPPEELPPGGIGVEDGRTVFYLERKPGRLGNWNTGERLERYYVLPPLPGAVLIILIGTVFAGFTRPGRGGKGQAAGG